MILRPPSCVRRAPLAHKSCIALTSTTPTPALPSYTIVPCAQNQIQIFGPITPGRKN